MIASIQRVIDENMVLCSQLVTGIIVKQSGRLTIYIMHISTLLSLAKSTVFLTASSTTVL